jgi:hypothetical protein
MKNLVSIFFLILFSNIIYAQNTLINVKVMVEGEEIEIKNGIRMLIIRKNDTLILNSSTNAFYLPDSLRGEKRNFQLEANDYKFYFGETLLTYNSLLPQWEIRLDNKPFLDDNKWLINKSNKQTKCIYSLINGTGSLFTVYSKKKVRLSAYKIH